MSSDYGRPNGPLTDKSGTASTTTAKLADSNPSRKYFYFQNLDTSIAMHLNFGAAATTGKGSIKVAAGASITFSGFCPTDQINVIAASGTPDYTAKEG